MFGVPHSLVTNGVVAKMPPEVISQILRPAIQLPLAKHLKGKVSNRKMPPGPSPSGDPRALT